MPHMKWWRADREPPPEEAQRAALWMYAVPLLVFGVVVWVVLVSWYEDRAATRSASEAPEASATSGSPGGFDPGPRPESTREELKLRGVGEPPQGPNSPLGEPELTGLAALWLGDAQRLVGRRINVRDAEVSEATGGTSFSIRQGDATGRVVAPVHSPPVRSGMRVDVSGVVESDDSGDIRIRADAVDRRSTP
jgi:hypothetical protein